MYVNRRRTYLLHCFYYESYQEQVDSIKMYSCCFEGTSHALIKALMVQVNPLTNTQLNVVKTFAVTVGVQTYKLLIIPN